MSNIITRQGSRPGQVLRCNCRFYCVELFPHCFILTQQRSFLLYLRELVMPYTEIVLIIFAIAFCALVVTLIPTILAVKRTA